MAEEADIHWPALGQVARAVRDHALLDEVSDLHEQTLTQIKWSRRACRKRRHRSSSPPPDPAHGD
jgi:hypothetical protein